jgi:hypothetical protein
LLPDVLHLGVGDDLGHEREHRLRVEGGVALLDCGPVCHPLDELAFRELLPGLGLGQEPVDLQRERPGEVGRLVGADPLAERRQHRADRPDRLPTGTQFQPVLYLAGEVAVIHVVSPIRAARTVLSYRSGGCQSVPYVLRGRHSPEVRGTAGLSNCS